MSVTFTITILSIQLSTKLHLKRLVSEKTPLESSKQNTQPHCVCEREGLVIWEADHFEIWTKLSFGLGLSRKRISLLQFKLEVFGLGWWIITQNSKNVGPMDWAFQEGYIAARFFFFYVTFNNPPAK